MPFNGPSPEKLYSLFEQTATPLDRRFAFRGHEPVPLEEIGQEHALVIISRQEGMQSDYGLLEVTGAPFSIGKKRLEITPQRDYHLFPTLDDAEAEMKVSADDNPDTLRDSVASERRDARYLLLNILRIQRRVERKLGVPWHHAHEL